VAPYQLIHKQAGREDRQNERDGSNFSTGVVSDRFVRLNLRFPFDSFRRNFERPRQNQRDGKTEDQQYNDKTNSPTGNVEKRKDLRRYLNQQPGYYRISDSNLVN